MTGSSFFPTSGQRRAAFSTADRGMVGSDVARRDIHQVRDPGARGSSSGVGSMAWIFLLIASVFEVCWAVGLKYSEGFTRLWPTAGTLVAMVGSFVFLSQAVKTLPLGTAYAVWTGIGAVGTAVAGMLLFDEPRDALRVASIGLIVVGIAGLRLSQGD